jgi:hypothetical protein
MKITLLSADRLLHVQLRPSLSKFKLGRSPQGLECACESASVDTVNSTSWKILLSRVNLRDDDILLCASLTDLQFLTELIRLSRGCWNCARAFALYMFRANYNLFGVLACSAF